MKIIFFGTPVFSAEILKHLIQQGVDVRAVVTQPDKVQGRHLKSQPSAVKRLATQMLPGVPLFQPAKVRDPAFIQTLRKINVDFYVVVAFGQIFPTELLELPPYGCINVHTSLLPKFRGAAPIQRAIIEGEQETGVCVMYMVEACDAGDILSYKKVPIPAHYTTADLTLELCKASKDLLFPTLAKALKGKIDPIKQDPNKVTYAKKVTAQTAHLDWTQTSIEVYNVFRGVSPKPGAWCFVQIRGKNLRLKIHEMALYPCEVHSPGHIVHYSSEGIAVSCKEGAVLLTALQLEGKKPLSSADFIKGYSKEELSFSPVEGGFKN